MQVYDIPINEKKREITPHGTPEFPLAVYSSVMSRNVLGCTPWHWHEELQLCLVTSGAIKFRIPGKVFTAETGSGIFINSGILHAADPAGNPDSAYICVNAGAALFRGFRDSVFERKYVRPYLHAGGFSAVLLSAQYPWQNEVLDMAAKLADYYNSRPFGWEMLCTALLWQAWIRLLQHAKAERQPADGNSCASIAVRKMLQYMAQHYGEQISIADIAEAAAFSSSECCRIFKRVTGRTIFGYLCSYRLEKSVSLLLETNASISDIACETGFCSSSYYIKAFRKAFGTTPLQYRKKRLAESSIQK